MSRPRPWAESSETPAIRRKNSIRGRNRGMLLGGARRHVVREQMRQAAHETNPGPEHGEAEQQCPGAGDGEHDDRTLESQRNERSQPQTPLRSRPRLPPVPPPPMASHVHGYALKGRSRIMSIAIKAIVPQRPIAAALATPWTVRAAAKKPGRNAARTPPASTMIINASELTIPAGRTREARTKRTTAAAGHPPTPAHPNRMEPRTRPLSGPR